MLDLWAREHYKSTIITFAKTIQDLVNDPELTVGIFSYNRPTAKRFLRQIMQEFERNNLLKSWFPEVLWQDPRTQSPKWSEDEGIVLKRQGNPKEASIEAWGLVDGMPTSSHYDIRVYDDVVTERSVTEGMLPRTTDAWELSLNLGKEGGVERYIGTRYADGDTYGTIEEREVAVPRVYPATDTGTPDGVPVLFSEEWLQKRRIGLSPYNFACQLLQNPIPGEEGYFVRDMFQYYDDVPRDHTGKPYGTVYMASDWATTEGGGDFTVHMVGRVANDCLYLLDRYKEQVDTYQGTLGFLGLVDKWKPVEYIAEKAQIEKSVGPFLHRMMQERGMFAGEALYSSASDKPTKAQSIRGWFGYGQVLFPRNTAWVSDLEAELLRFDRGKHDDQVDTLGLFGRHLEFLRGKRKPAVPEKPRGQTIDDIERQKRRARLGIGRKEAYYVT